MGTKEILERFKGVPFGSESQLTSNDYQLLMHLVHMVENPPDRYSPTEPQCGELCAQLREDLLETSVMGLNDIDGMIGYTVEKSAAGYRVSVKTSCGAVETVTTARAAKLSDARCTVINEIDSRNSECSECECCR